MEIHTLMNHSTRFNSLFFFFFNDTATTEIYTLSLHDALPISFFPPTSSRKSARSFPWCSKEFFVRHSCLEPTGDRKSTRLNSSHGYISYAVFCLKKKKIYYSYYYTT